MKIDGSTVVAAYRVCLRPEDDRALKGALVVLGRATVVLRDELDGDRMIEVPLVARCNEPELGKAFALVAHDGGVLTLVPVGERPS